MSDSDARSQALETQQSFIVQAPAGSGKTELLTQRVLALLAVVEEPEHILAITFTNKAAAEMRHRILQSLRAAQTQPRPEKAHAQQTYDLAAAALAQNHAQQWNLLEQPTRLRVQTIDSLCATIVRQHPLQSGVGAAAKVTEKPRDLYRLAARRTLALLEAEEDALAASVETLLAHLNNDLHRVEELLCDMLGRRDQWLRPLSRASDDPERLRRELEQTFAEVIQLEMRALPQCFPETSQQTLQGIVQAALTNLQAAGSEIAQLAALQDWNSTLTARAEDLPKWQALGHFLLTKEGKWRKQFNRNHGFPAGDAGKAMKEAVRDLLSAQTPENAELLHRVRNFPYPLRYEEDAWEVLWALLQILQAAANTLQRVFRSEGAVDFAEVSQRAERALQERPNPINAPQELRHLLVDEFQDTSQGQFQLLESLTSEWPKDGSHTLFVVGDPMQSIYRFRQAEVSLFRQVQQFGLSALRPIPLQLRRNFRSQQGIVDWVNATFAQVLPSQENVAVGAICYEPSEGVHPALAAPPAVEVHLLRAEEEQAEANRVVSLIQRTLEGTDEDHRVGVLVRNRGHLTELLPALRRAQIPFRAVEIERLAEQQVVEDLLHLTRAVVHEGDRGAWLAILRAPWCGLTLADLTLLFGEPAEHERTVSAILWENKRWDALSQDGQQRLIHFQQAWEPVASQRWHLSLRELVERLWLRLRGPQCLHAHTELQHAESFFSLLEDLEQRQVPLPDRLEEAVQELFAQPDTTDARVEVMTMHKSKGLQFGTVILPGLHRPSRNEETPLLQWREQAVEERPSALLLAPIHEAGSDETSKNRLYEYLRDFEKEKSRYELGRLMYVAVTRAEQHLHLCGALAEDAKNHDWSDPPANTALGMLWASLREQALIGALPPAEPRTAASVTLRPAMLERLPREQCLPERAVNSPPAIKPSWHEEDAVLLPEEPAAGWMGRELGVHIHAILQQIAEDGLDAWPVTVLPQRRSSWELALRNKGFPEARLSFFSGRIEQAIRTTLQDPRGRWLLQANTDAFSELELTSAQDGALVRRTIDRTFVDEGVRWIVDYKSSEPRSEETLEEFRERQSRSYAPQLRSYRELFQQMEERAVRCALYFPLVGEWLELFTEEACAS